MQKTIAKCRPDLLITDINGQGQAQLSALLRSQGYRFYAIDDTAREIEIMADMVVHGGRQDLNRLASVREPGDIAQLARQAHGRPLKFG